MSKNSEKSKGTVLQILPSLKSGGVERGTLEMAVALKEAGFRPLVASSGGPLVRTLEQAGIGHYTLPLHRKTPWEVFHNIRRLAKLIREEQVDLLHARSRAPAWSGYYAARRTGCHFVTTFHGTYGLDGPFKQRYNAIMTKGEKVIAISEFIERHIRENYSMERERLVTIPRGVDLKAFDPKDVDEVRMMRLFHYLALPSDVPVILMPARLTRWKGHTFLLEALAKLSHRQFFCLIIGDSKDHGAYQEELNILIRRYGLVGHVKIVPHTYDIAATYHVASLVACVSLDPEAFGRVAVEAQAMGKPVVATNHGGYLETILPGTTGWLVPPHDVPALAKALEEALETIRKPGARDVIAEACKKHARENFPITRMTSATLEVYREVLSKPVQLPALKDEASG